LSEKEVYCYTNISQLSEKEVYCYTNIS
jgi:hypothetical protein